MKVRRSLLMAIVAPLVVVTAVAAESPMAYRVFRKIALGGEGGWDYLTLDGSTHRLFIARATRVMVVNTDSGKEVGEIPRTSGVHGVVLVPGLKRGFTSNGKESTVSIFDLGTLRVLKKVKTGEDPDAILYDSFSGRVFTMNGKGHDATAIDAAGGKVAGSIPLGGKPEFAVSDGAGHLYVNLEDRSEIAVLDPRGLSVKSRWPLAPCEEPSGLALDEENRRLFVGCGNKIMAVVDAETGKVVTTLPIGEGVDGNAFDPDTRLAFASNGDGTLTIVRQESPDEYEVVGNLETAKGARTMALDTRLHRVYLVTAEFGPAPQAIAETPHPRPVIIPGSFRLLVVGRE